MNTYFSEENIQMASKYTKKYSTSLVTEEVKMKTMLRFHLVPEKVTTIKKPTNINCWRGYGERGIL